MKLKLFSVLILFLGLASAFPQNLASPYSNSVFPAQVFTSSGQTGSVIQLNGLVVSSTVGSSFASGLITLTGSSLTTVTFAIQGSSDNGLTYFPLAISAISTPGTTTTSVTSTANGLYQVSLAGLTHVRFVTSGTFTATNIRLVLTGSPNGIVARSTGGGPTNVVNGTNFGPSANPDQVPLTTASNVATWSSINDCGDSTHAVSYNTATHAFGCQSIAGGAANPAPPQFAVQLANADASAFATDPSITVNSTTHTLATPSVAAANPVFALNMGAHTDTVSDFVQFNTNGTTIKNPVFAAGIPWNLTQNVNRRFGPASGATPLEATLNLMSGPDNTNVVQGNYGGFFVSTNAWAPQQGGGIFAVQGHGYAVGDTVGKTMVLLGRGVSRQEDEGQESPRDFLGAMNDTAGGHLTSVTTDAQGNNPIAVSQIQNVYSFNFYEKSFIIDVSKKVQSPGNIASIGTSTDDRFEFFQGDATSGITAQLGVSTQTSLTAPVDNFVYTGSCGSQTKTAQQYPTSGPSTGANDGFMTNYQGVGVAGENTNYATNGALVGYCATVASTAGMSAGTLLFIADGDYQVEFTRVIGVVDATHFTAFMRQPHSSGATVNFGGGIGYGIGADIDITPIGTNSTTNNPQVATQRLVYPIVQSFAGDLVNVYTNIEGSDQNNLRTLLPQANTPKVPLTITNPIVTGGVLTGFTANNVIGNANNYVGNNNGATNSGHPSFLPAPLVTVGGCVVPPVLGMTTVNGSAGVTYSPTIISGGSGCPANPTFSIPSFYPTPFGIFPMAMVYKSEDPSLPAGTVANGKPVFMPFITSAWSIGDEVMTPDWWNGGGVGGVTRYEGNYMHSMDGRNGHQQTHFFSGVGTGHAAEAWINEDPTAHYFGTFANNYTKVNPTDFIVPPPIWLQADGQFATDFNLAVPPVQVASGLLQPGAIINVTCAGDLLITGFDPPCFHGINSQYDLFRETPKVGGIAMNMFVNPTTGVMGVGAATTTWQAPTLTAYDAVQATTDVVLAGVVNPGPNRGACVGFDLLLTTTGHPFGSRNAHVCGFGDNAGGNAGDIAFEVNPGGGATIPTLRVLTLTPTLATFTKQISSTVATGTAPLSVTSTTLVPNLNVGTVDNVTISGTPATGMVPTATSTTTATWQTPPTPTINTISGVTVSGTPSGGQILQATAPNAATWANPTSGFTGNFNITTPTGTCGFSFSAGLLQTKTGSC